MLSINVDVLDVLIISRIDKSPTQSLWFVEIQSITKYADQWCPECDEGLCSDCENHHKVSKSSRNHGVISIENFHKLPSFISEIGNHCEYHDMKYTHFCQHHDKACCPDCIYIFHIVYDVMLPSLPIKMIRTIFL
jgi:hypothetical protein